MPTYSNLSPQVKTSQQTSAATPKRLLYYFAITLCLQVIDATLAFSLNHIQVLALSNLYICKLIAERKIERSGLYFLILAQLLGIWLISSDLNATLILSASQFICLEIFYSFLRRHPLLGCMPPDLDLEEKTSNIGPASYEQGLLKNFTRICSAWLVASTLSALLFGFLTANIFAQALVNISEYWLANICSFVLLHVPIMENVTQNARSHRSSNAKEKLITHLSSLLFLTYCLLIINTNNYPAIYILLPLCLLAIRLPVRILATIIYQAFAGIIIIGISPIAIYYSFIPPINLEVIHALCLTGFIPLFFAFLVKAFEKRQGQIIKLSERMSLANKAVGLGVWEWCISSRKVLWDQAMYNLYGIGQQTITYSCWRHCIHPDDVSQLERLLKNMARAKNEFSICFRIIHPEFGIRHIQAAATIVYGEDNRPLRYVGMNWDVTGVKEAELALNLAKQKAEEASQIKGEFVANMSHEIRTPLNAALGAAQLLQNTDLSAVQKKYTNMIKNSGESLLAIVNDILDFSKIESGHTNVALNIFNIKDTAEKIATILSPQAGAKGLEFILHIDKNVPTFVEGDELKLHQVLTNLTSNAIRFTHGGEVTIEIKSQKIQPGKVRLLFAVVDTGIGIAKNKQLNLFDAFTQVDSSSTRQYGGTGLGLAIAKRLVNLMGGELELESDEGVGSRFHFSLELTQIAQRNFSHPLEGKPLRVLLLDSNPRLIDAVKHLVAPWPWDLIAATTAEQVLNIFPTANNLKPFDLLIIERNTFLMQQPFLLQQLIKLGLTDNCLRIASEINHAASATAEGTSTLIDSYLMKPITHTGLLDAIQEGRNKRHGVVKPLQAELSLPTQLLDGINILLVEDNPLNQVVAKGLLEQFGARIDQAWNGREALELISQNLRDYHLILLDIQMPVMDGYSTCHALKERGYSIPIIAMTAGVLSSERELCESAGMQGFVSKPFEIHNLLEEIQKLIATSERTDTLISSNCEPIENTLFYPERLLRHITGSAQVQNIVVGIEQLITQYEPRQKELIASIEAADLNQAARILHSQKGAWGNLGATALYRQISSLETLAHEGRLRLDCRQWHLYTQLFTQTLKEAIDWLSRHNASTCNHIEHPQKPDKDAINAFLSQLNENNFSACEYYSQLKGALTTAVGAPLAAQLDLAMTNLDFIRAAGIVGTYLATLTAPATTQL